ITIRIASVPIGNISGVINPISVLIIEIVWNAVGAGTIRIRRVPVAVHRHEMETDIDNRIRLHRYADKRGVMVQAGIGGVATSMIDQCAEHAIIGWIIGASEGSNREKQGIGEDDVVSAVGLQAGFVGDVAIVVAAGKIRAMVSLRDDGFIKQ